MTGKVQKRKDQRVKGCVKRKFLKQKADPNTYKDILLSVPFRILGLFAFWKRWPFGKTKPTGDMEKASGAPLLNKIALMLLGGLELFAIWKRWPFKSKIEPVLPLTLKDDEKKNIEDEMAEQKRKLEKRLEEKDDQIEEGQKRLKTMEGQMIAFQENLKQKDNDISELKKENNELVSKLKRSEQNLLDTNKELDGVRDMKNDAEAKTRQRDNQIGKLQTEKNGLDSTLKRSERERINFYNDLLTAKKQLHDTKEKLVEVQEQKREAEAEKHDALRRLSEMVSVKLRDNNPNIVDLNDEYRPTKLADMFSELYDNEWTAAYTVMEEKEFQDRQMIDFLLDVVMESYIFCKNEVENSWDVVSKWFLHDDLPKVQQTRKALKDGRKAIALKLIPDIEKEYTSYIISICRHKSLKELLSSEDIRKYMALCFKLTLLMNANDPPVYLECSGWEPIRNRQKEDKDLLESEHSVSKLPGNGVQPENQNDKDKDLSNVVGTDKQGGALTVNGDSDQDLNKEGATDDVGEERIEDHAQINEDNKPEEDGMGQENGQNADCSGERENDKNKEGTESDANMETELDQKRGAVAGKGDSDQDLNKEGATDDVGEERIEYHAQINEDNKPEEDGMDQENGQNADCSGERENDKNKEGTESDANMETELDQKREAVAGNGDSGKDLNSDDTENIDAEHEDQIERLENNAKPGVTGDSGQEHIEHGGKITETELNLVNDAGQNVDVKREEPQQTHDPLQSEGDQGSMNDKIARDMENDTRLCKGASIDSDASSPTNDEDDTQKALIYEDNFKEHPETNEREEENEMTDSKSPNSGCDLSDKQLKHEYDKDDSKQIYATEVRNEEIAAAPRGEFEKDKYKEYTTRGKYTEFHVWPIMYLHKGGPMLAKGIAQGVKDSKAEPSDKRWAWWK